mmetsp:Transcript_30385/g.30033  ORF Transcript_30385/g.30033 Transcript_30385/m.30033 type:complete len:117 (+) Transcript_30385:50-400(+)
MQMDSQSDPQPVQDNNMNTHTHTNLNGNTNSSIQNIDNDIRVAVIGNVDSGKSTLVGVLTRCITDDGRGSARSYVFNYKHELSNGRTSSISHEIMGFSPNGSQVSPEHLTDSKNKT